MAENRVFDFQFLARITETMWESGLAPEKVDWNALTTVFSNGANYDRDVICRHVMLAQVIHLNFQEALGKNELRHIVDSVNGTAGAACLSPSELEKIFLVDEQTGAIRQLQPKAVTLDNPINERLQRLSWDCLYAYRGKLSWKPDESQSFIDWYRAVDRNGGNPSGVGIATNAKMCCYEAVFYALINSKVLPWNALARSYSANYLHGNNGPQAASDIWDDLANFVSAKGRAVQEVVLNDASYPTKAFKVGDIIMNPDTNKRLDPNNPLSASEIHDFFTHVGMVCQSGVGGQTKVMHLHVHAYGVESSFVEIITIEEFATAQYNHYPQRPRIVLFNMF